MLIRRMDISTNVGCKVNCNYCPHQKAVQHLKGSSSYKMSFETFKACLKTMPKDVEICFAGFSEPFLNEDCSDMILYASSNGFPVQVYTTTVGLNKDILEKIKHVNFVSFEIHMPTKSGDERIVVDSNYKKLLKHIYDTIGNVHFTFVCKEKGDEKLDLVDFANKKNIHIEKAHSRAGNVSNLPQIAIKYGPLACDRKLISNVLLPNGDVSICCQDFHTRHIIGNLLQQSYKSIFESKEFQKFQELMNLEYSNILCRTCEYAIQVENHHIEK